MSPPEQKQIKKLENFNINMLNLTQNVKRRTYSFKKKFTCELVNYNTIIILSIIYKIIVSTFYTNPFLICAYCNRIKLE